MQEAIATKATILVLEDDVHLLSGIRDILELEKYQVITAQNGEEGLEALESMQTTPPDIILSDIMMPKMNGFDFLEQVRKENRWMNTPVIFLTAKGTTPDKHRGKQLGVDDYLTKPFDAKDLIVAIDAKIDLSKKRRDASNEVLERKKNEMIQVLNHEFRTPLTLIIGYSDMLKGVDGAPGGGPDMNMFLNEITSGAERIRRLIENFILLVELDSGDAQKTYAWRAREVTDLPSIMRDAHRQIFGVMTERECPVQIEEDLPPIIGDMTYLTIAIRELFNNAVKFSTNGEELCAGIRTVGSTVEIWVEDHGRGIPEHELDKIWDSFYQINREYFEDQGTGTGLAIVRGVTNIHNGQYFVDTEVDKGSTFRLQIPIYKGE